MAEPIQLDLTDKRILYQLDSNSRQPLTQIAKKLNTSQQLVDYRIKNYEKNGLISSYVTLIDYKKFGLVNYTVYFRFRQVDSKREKEIVDYFCKLPNTNIVFTCEGNWELGVGFLVDNIFGFNEEFTKAQRLFQNNIADFTITTHLQSSHFGRKYLLAPEEFEDISIPAITGGKPLSLKLTDTEAQVLRVLSVNSRLSLVESAKLAKLSPRIFHYQLKKLIENEVIVGYSVRLNPELLGYNFYRLLLRLHAPSAEEKNSLSAYLKTYPNVLRAIDSFGRYDLLIDAEFEGVRALREFTLDLRSRFGAIISTQEILRFYNVEKYSYFPSGECKR
ncbi:MAG: winged helix-turn-helix transcriptional regulator [Candidatus Micrarchaeota archaeon]